MENEKDKQLRQMRNTFLLKVKSWLVPLGFVEIFKNHPCLSKPRIDMIKYGIRVCCIKDRKEEYFYLNAEVYLKEEVLTLKTGKYFINDRLELNRLLNIVSVQKKKLEKTNFINTGKVHIV